MALDTQLFYLLNSLAGRSPLLNAVIVFLASYFAYILIAVFIALIFFSQYSKREKWEIVLVAGLAGIIARFGVAEAIRFFFPRERPYEALHLSPLFTDTASSFPSGHATFFFAMATAIYLYNKKWGLWFFAAAALITVSRVIAGVHYPSDIIGGALIGALVGYLTFIIARRTAQKTLIRPLDRI